MQNLIFASLVMFILTVASPSNAATPANLVELARNGYFKEQGIPSFIALEDAVSSGQINGEDLVQAAVERNRISSDLSNDSNYVSSVDRQLDLLMEKSY